MKHKKVKTEKVSAVEFLQGLVLVALFVLEAMKDVDKSVNNSKNKKSKK